jgi:hypothetical protein
MSAQVVSILLVTAAMLATLEVLQHLAAALLCQSCPPVEVEAVITRQVVNQAAAAAVVAAAQVGMVDQKHFMPVLKAL